MTLLRQQSAQPSCEHASPEAYATYIRGYTQNARQIRHLLGFRARFVQRYPDLGDWFAAPLAERVGRLYGEERKQPTCRVSYEARPYLMFLALDGYAQFDWEWLLAVPRLSIWNLLDRVGQDLGTVELIEEAVGLGYDREGATHALQWAVSRMFLHTSNPHVESIGDTHLTVVSEAIGQFGERSDLALFFGPVAHSHQGIARRYTCNLHLLHVILYHRGQVSKEPRRFLNHRNPRPVMKPRMEAVVARYLTARGLTDRPGTIGGLDLALRQFIGWLAPAYPEVQSFAQVTREHLLEFAEAMNTMVGTRTHRPLATLTKRGRLSRLCVFFQDVAKWGWNDVPDRPLLGSGDLPKIPARVPRYIPEDELARLMPAIRSLTCSYQRAALLIARWSGARREEIRRLAMDCLDSYADGTPRLRIPAGKTKRERIVPLNEEAAAAIRVLQADRKTERGFRDTQTGIVTRYLFVRHGQLISLQYLFDASLQTVCTAAGLTTADGKPTISAHRFRHTVGTQLAERGAKLRTIMNVLGHSSASMSMVYAQISDREVLKEYQAVLGPGAAIAGPFAETLRSGQLSASAVDWLKSNFFKTELELGRCLRLPQEGPCECELYLMCTKFVTTPEYAPRLRRRRRIEQALAQDAGGNGRSSAISRRCAVLSNSSPIWESPSRVRRQLSDQRGCPLQSDVSVSRQGPGKKEKARGSMEYVNIMEAARRCAVSDKTIRRAIHKGTLPARFPKPNRCEIAVSDLEHFTPGQVQGAVQSRIAALERRVEALEQQVQRGLRRPGASKPSRPSPRAERTTGPLPRNLVPLPAFAQKHSVAEHKALAAIEMGLLPVKCGEWTNQHGTLVTRALDPKGRQAFYQIYQGVPPFVPCEQCPHEGTSTPV